MRTAAPPSERADAAGGEDADRSPERNPGPDPEATSDKIQYVSSPVHAGYGHITSDPAWNGGNYTSPPMQGMRAAMGQLFVMTSAPLVQQRQAPSREAADSAILAYIDRVARALDANDVIYAFDASRHYDPSEQLASIQVPVLAINSADDFVNPPELGLMERLIPLVPNARYVLVSVSDSTRGHGTHSRPAVWHHHLEDFMRFLPPIEAAEGSDRK